MSDLSRMLDDLYALPATDADDGFEPALATAPSWSSDAALDEVFSSWVPGETPSTPMPTPVPVVALDDEPDLTPAPEPQPEPASEPLAPVAAVRPWVPSDDDILPRRVRSRRGRRRP